MGKVKNVVILGVGYVLGTKAGRARYEQLKQQATRVAEHPRTQQLARSAREQVSTRMPASVTQRLPQSVTSRLATSPSATPAPAPAPSSTSVGYPEGSATINPATEATRPSHI